MDDKNYEKYAYFVSKARNYSVIFKPCVEEVLADGSRRIAKDDDGKEMVGLRIEFDNYGKRIEKTKENMPMIEFLRAKCKGEDVEDPKRQQIKEKHKPIKMVKEDEMNAKLAEKDEEIKKLKESMTSTASNVKVETF